MERKGPKGIRVKVVQGQNEATVEGFGAKKIRTLMYSRAIIKNIKTRIIIHGFFALCHTLYIGFLHDIGTISMARRNRRRALGPARRKRRTRRSRTSRRRGQAGGSFSNNDR